MENNIHIFIIIIRDIIPHCVVSLENLRVHMQSLYFLRNIRIINYNVILSRFKNISLEHLQTHHVSSAFFS